MARLKYTLIFGGAGLGLMGELAQAVHEGGGRVVGVIPRMLYRHGLSYADADELIVTKTVRERKEIMEARADAFIALPGGFGTLEEVLEIIALKQLGYMDKPICLVNTKSYYSHLKELFGVFYMRKFAQPEHSRLYHFCPDSKSALTYITNYNSATLPRKW